MDKKLSNYFNKELNIRINYVDISNIEEHLDHVAIRVNGVLYFEIKKDAVLTFDTFNSISIYDDTEVCAYNNAIVSAYSNSTVVAFNKAVIKAHQTSNIYAYDNTDIFAYDSSKVFAYQEAIVFAYNSSKVRANNDVKVYARNFVKVYAWNRSVVTLNEDTLLKAHGAIKAYAYGSAVVYAFDRTKVKAYDFTTVYKRSIRVKVTKDNPLVNVFDQVFKVPKKMLVYKKLKKDLIATLQLKRGQVFQSLLHSKCRTDRALVVAIESIDGKIKYSKGYSSFEDTFVYEVGKTVSTVYDPDIKECSSGIHFFLSRKAAEEY